MDNRPYTFFYGGQIRRYITQFMRVFAGLQVEHGVDRDGDKENDRELVPIVWGLPDRVVAARLNNGGTFQASKLPLISVFMTGILPNPEVRKAPLHVENVPYIDSQGKRTALVRTMGVPYKASMDVHLYASNSDQMLQMKEQLLLMFNPDLAIQASNSFKDWSYITKVNLVSINNDTTFPMGELERVQTESLSFTFDFWLNFPLADRDALIQTIITRVFDNSSDSSGVLLDELLVNSHGKQ